jgi:FXSXX-COOH protein
MAGLSEVPGDPLGIVTEVARPVGEPQRRGPAGIEVESAPPQEWPAGLPDLTDLPLDALADLGDTVLARAIRIARSRRAAAGIVYAGFNNNVIIPDGAFGDPDGDG